MNEILLTSWKVLAWRGMVSLLFGVLAALWPSLTLMWLIVIFAAYALIWGAVSITSAVRNRESNDDWWLLLLLGTIGLAGGVGSILYPDLTALMLVLVIGGTSLASGIVDIAMAIRLRKIIRGEALLILNGIVSIAFGVFVFFFPGPGALALVWLISIYATISGVLLLALAWRARQWKSPDETWPYSARHGV
jgi:uncharacterized membrane protein HdeD (DUF308 family)